MTCGTQMYYMTKEFARQYLEECDRPHYMFLERGNLTSEMFYPLYSPRYHSEPPLAIEEALDTDIGTTPAYMEDRVINFSKYGYENYQKRE
jgi:hypothetical protein